MLQEIKKQIAKEIKANNEMREDCVKQEDFVMAGNLRALTFGLEKALSIIEKTELKQNNNEKA
jgi:hypothetical protein